MIWYKFHVGDYITHTLHLSDAEDLAYRRLLDMYYLTEKPIPKDIEIVCRKIRLDADIVESVLKEFFQPAVDGWFNQRCEEEILKYNKFLKHNQRIAKNSAKARKGKASGKRVSKGSDGGQPAVSLRSACGEPAVNQTETETDTDTEKEKTRKPPSPAATAFADFWQTWPASKRKVGKGACEARWQAKKLDSFAQQILAHVRAMKQTAQWREGFEPAPLTYLTQSRWLDEISDGDNTNSENSVKRKPK